MKKEARIHRLPTEEGCIAFERDYGFKFIGTTREGYYKTKTQQPFHLYITTDEEIKEGDWVLWFWDNGQIGVTAPHQYLGGEQVLNSGHRKIIATTDPKLLVDWEGHEKYTGREISAKVYLPQIPQSFIEEYCKQGGIDEVLVEYEVEECGYDEGQVLYDIDNPILKLDNNCIIIHHVEEKMYSRDEVEEIVYNATKEVPNEDQDTVLKWIEDNL